MASDDKSSGKTGGSLALAILNIVDKGLPNSDQGGLPVAISMTVHPTLHISE